jgi:hypothetical protein
MLSKLWARYGAIVLVIIFLLVCIGEYSHVLSNSLNKTDFIVFHSAAQIFLDKTQLLYDPHLQTNVQHQILAENSTKVLYYYLPFVNPLIVLIGFLPTVKLNALVAYKLMVLLYLALYFLLFTLIKRLIISNERSPFFIHLLLLSSAPVAMSVTNVQTVLLYLFVFIGLIYFYLKDNYLMTGVFAAFLWVNPQLALLLTLALLICGNKRLKTGILIGSFLFALINFLPLGKAWHTFISFFLWYSSQFATDTFLMISLYALIAQLGIFFKFINVLVWTYTSSFIVMYVSLYFVYVYRTKPHILLKLMPMLLVGTLLSGVHVHVHSASVLVFVFWYYYKYYKDNVYFWSMVVLGWVIFFADMFLIWKGSYMFFLPTIYIFCLYIMTVKEFRMATRVSNQ